LRKKEIEKSEMFNIAFTKIESLTNTLKSADNKNTNNKTEYKRTKEIENEIERYKSVILFLI
jgi:hypothetical protein